MKPNNLRLKKFIVSMRKINLRSELFSEFYFVWRKCYMRLVVNIFSKCYETAETSSNKYVFLLIIPKYLPTYQLKFFSWLNNVLPK